MSSDHLSRPKEDVEVQHKHGVGYRLYLYCPLEWNVSSCFQYLSSRTVDGEMEFFRKVFDAGVYILPGHQTFSRELGWFRLTFTRDRDMVEKGMMWNLTGVY